jgi:hypothetical protein
MSGKPFFWLIGFVTFFLASCQVVNDLQPAGDELPPSVVQVLKAEFPAYDEVKVTTLEKDRVWSASLKVDTNRYEVILNSIETLSVHRYSHEQAPKLFVSGLNNTILKDGTFADLKIRRNKPGQYYEEKDFEAVFTHSGVPYFAEWNSLSYSIKHMTFYPGMVARYKTTYLNDLPDNIQTIISRKITEGIPGQPAPVFDHAWVEHYRDGRKTYIIKLGTLNLEIGPAGEIFTTYNNHFNVTTDLFEAIHDATRLPEAITTYLGNDPVASTFTRFSSAFKSTDQEKQVYRVHLNKQTFHYILYFDANYKVVNQYLILYIL